MYISLGWGGFKAPQHVYQPRDGSSHPSLLSPSCLCESSSSNSIRTSAHVHARTLLGLPPTSALGHSSDSHSHLHSDVTQTPTHACARTLLGLLLTSALGLYSEPHSSSVIHPPLRNTRPPPCKSILTYTNLTRSSVSIRAMSSRNSTQTSVSQFILQVRARAFGPCSDLHPCPHYNPNPCHPTPLRGPLRRLLGYPCLTPSYSSSPCLRGLLGPPSLSTLQVLHGSEPLVT
jgi:hypothetical protein